MARFFKFSTTTHDMLCLCLAPYARRQHAAAKLSSAPATVQSASSSTSVLDEVHPETPSIVLQSLASIKAKEVASAQDCLLQ